MKKLVLVMRVMKWISQDVKKYKNTKHKYGKQFPNNGLNGVIMDGKWKDNEGSMKPKLYEPNKELP